MFSLDSIIIMDTMTSVDPIMYVLINHLGGSTINLGRGEEFHPKWGYSMLIPYG